jgi:hypothetical protein
VKTLIVASLCLLLAGCVGNEEQLRADSIQQMPYRAIGYASLRVQPGSTPAQKQLMAIRAAKAAAMRELAEKIFGADVSGQTSLIGGGVYSDQLRSSVDGLVRGARVVSLTPIRNDVYEAVLEVDAWEVAAMRARWPRGHFQ